MRSRHDSYTKYTTLATLIFESQLELCTRSSNENLLVLHSIGLNGYCKCIFKMGAAMLRSSITYEHLKQGNDITTFKKQLKSVFSTDITALVLV